MVNESIYVFGGCSDTDAPVGEKYTLSENRWRDVRPKDQQQRVIGAAALLYE